jgi:hypothetical protein
VEHFVSTREWECLEFARTVTSWELKSFWDYLGMIMMQTLDYFQIIRKAWKNLTTDIK